MFIHRLAFVDSRMYMELEIAQKFTDIFGVPQMYVSKENIYPGLSSWPIGHDAPYKESFDKAIKSIMEVSGGPFDKAIKSIIEVSGAL